MKISLLERRWKNLVVTLISMAYIFVGGGIFVLLGQGSARKLESKSIFPNPKEEGPTEKQVCETVKMDLKERFKASQERQLIWNDTKLQFEVKKLQ